MKYYPGKKWLTAKIVNIDAIRFQFSYERPAGKQRNLGWVPGFNKFVSDQIIYAWRFHCDLTVLSEEVLLHRIYFRFVILYKAVMVFQFLVVVSTLSLRSKKAEESLLRPAPLG